MLDRVVSGGQTGVDRAALDAAIALGFPVGGWCPRGRRAEDGPIPDIYPLQETSSIKYIQRTLWNVRDSDATLIIHASPLTGGTAYTLEQAERLGKPVLCCTVGEAFSAQYLFSWIIKHDIGTLNVAGPRESTEPGIYVVSRSLLLSWLSMAPVKT